MVKKTDSHFRAVASTYLAQRGMTQTALAQAMGCNATYANHVFTGHRLPQSDWVDLVAKTLNLSDDQSVELHKAAAKDHGFKLDLTKP